MHNAGFEWVSHLKNHMMIHTGEKLHKCAQCSKSFGRAGHLKKHLVTLSDILGISCTIVNNAEMLEI